MGEGLAKLIGALMLLCAIVYVAVLLVLVALAIAAIVTPPYGAYRWLRHLLTTRYTLSPAKRKQCLAIGLASFGLPLLLLLCPSVPAPLAWWLGITLSLTFAALFLTIEAYRQAVWPHHKMIWHGWRKWVQCQYRLLLANLSLQRVHRCVKAKEYTHGDVVREYQRITNLVPALIQWDPAFLSAERLRLEQELPQLTVEGLTARHAQIQELLAKTQVRDPKSVVLTLEAALTRIEINARALADGQRDGWKEHLRAREFLQNQIAVIRTKTQALRRQIRQEGLSIRKLQQEQLHLT